MPNSQNETFSKQGLSDFAHFKIKSVDNNFWYLLKKKNTISSFSIHKFEVVVMLVFCCFVWVLKKFYFIVQWQSSLVFFEQNTKQSVQMLRGLINN